MVRSNVVVLHDYIDYVGCNVCGMYSCWECCSRCLDDVIFEQSWMGGWMMRRDRLVRKKDRIRREGRIDPRARRVWIKRVRRKESVNHALAVNRAVTDRTVTEEIY